MYIASCTVVGSRPWLKLTGFAERMKEKEENEKEKKETRKGRECTKKSFLPQIMISILLRSFGARDQAD